MYRSYTIRLKTTRRQNAKLSALLVELCEIYNAALQERTEAWKLERKLVTRYEQYRELTQLRAIDQSSAAFPATVQRDPIRRVDLAFNGFFRRIKAGNKPGYPRFRSVARYNSFKVDCQNFRIDGNRVIVRKLGGFRFSTRCRIRGTPKVFSVKRVGGKWRGAFVCDIGPAPEKQSVSNAIGIDLGIEALVTLSDGTQIKNQRWTAREAERVAKSNRAFSRKMDGSNNQTKAKEHCRRVHQRIHGLRRAYLHEVSNWLISRYDLIAYEKLNIPEMLQSSFSKSISDAAWGELIRQLTYKAEEAGKYVVAVNPRGTSQICSGCGTKIPKAIVDRQHSCHTCGLSLGRDHNAAINVLQRGMRCVEQSARG
jgi:putative transposase